MTKQNIKALLKEGLTGDEAGRIYAHNKLTQDPPFSEEEIRLLEMSMVSRRDKAVFDQYGQLYNDIDYYLHLCIIASLEVERDVNLVSAYMKDSIVFYQVSAVFETLKKTKAYSSKEFKDASLPEMIKDVETFIGSAINPDNEKYKGELREALLKMSKRIANNALLLTMIRTIVSGLFEKIDFKREMIKGRFNIFLADNLPTVLDNYNYWARLSVFTRKGYGEPIDPEALKKDKVVVRLKTYIARTEIASMDYKKIHDIVKKVCEEHGELA